MVSEAETPQNKKGRQNPSTCRTHGATNHLPVRSPLQVSLGLFRLIDKSGNRLVIHFSKSHNQVHLVCHLRKNAVDNFTLDETMMSKKCTCEQSRQSRKRFVRDVSDIETLFFKSRNGASCELQGVIFTLEVEIDCLSHDNIPPYYTRLRCRDYGRRCNRDSHINYLIDTATCDKYGKLPLESELTISAIRSNYAARFGCAEPYSVIRISS